MKSRVLAIARAACLLGCLFAAPAQAQLTVLDQAQDEARKPAPAAPPPLCGSQPLTIARMGWPSAALLAEIHALVLARALDCDVRVSPGDLAATASSMGSTGQPAVAPEMWVTRIADVWNGAIERQMVRSIAPTYTTATFEGWFMSAALANGFAVRPAAADLAVALPQLRRAEPLRFISCPADWACSIINDNLIRAHGLAGLVDIVVPANRFEMDRLIAEAVSRREPFMTYYWQPNGLLAQLDFVALDMGAFDAAATTCLAQRQCEEPKASSFPAEIVVTAVADRMFSEMPAIAGYFQRATLPIAEMNLLLAQLSEPGTSVEGVAARFLAEREDLWGNWVGR